MERDRAIEVISHEIIHITQYVYEDLIYQNGVVYWKGKEYKLEDISYDSRPWEDDTYKPESELYSLVNNS